MRKVEIRSWTELAGVITARLRTAMKSSEDTNPSFITAPMVGIVDKACTVSEMVGMLDRLDANVRLVREAIEEWKPEWKEESR